MLSYLYTHFRNPDTDKHPKSNQLFRVPQQNFTNKKHQ